MRKGSQSQDLVWIYSKTGINPKLREHSKALSRDWGGWEEIPTSGWTTTGNQDRFLRTHSPADNTSFLNLSVGCPIRQIKEATEGHKPGSPPFTSHAILSPPSVRFPRFFFFFIKNHNENALFPLVGGFHLFPSVLCGFHWNRRDPPDASAGPITTLVSNGWSWIFYASFSSTLYLFSRSSRLSSGCAHLAVLKMRLNTLFTLCGHSFGEQFKRLNVFKVW